MVARLMGVGLTRPKARVAGIDAAGVVEAAGANVRGLANGDDVLGFPGARSRSTRAPQQDLVVPTAGGPDLEQAAAVPIAATTALRGIREVGEVTGGRRLLVNRAAAGSAVTPSRSRRRWALRSPGCAARATPGWCARSAPRTSWTTRPTTSPAGGRYEVILDNVSSLPLSRLRGALTPKGILVLNGGGSPGHVFGPVARHRAGSGGQRVRSRSGYARSRPGRTGKSCSR